RVAIIGLGLMGGSLGLALREGKLARQIIGYDAQPEAAAEALARHLVDSLAPTPAGVVANADLIVIAIPTLAVRATLAAITPACAPGALITDLCSVKEPVVAWAEATLPQPGRFVGGHPMTGRERSGPAAAQTDLYRGARWPLTPTSVTNPAALARITSLVTALGATPLLLPPEKHDWLVAAISHLPLLAATALMQTLAETDDWPEMAQLAAGGFRDTTRVAAGDPIMGRDICLTNRLPILRRLDAYLAELSALRQAIDTGDKTTLEAIFRAAQASRRVWEHEAGS
ncbi:MAG TPA: prephenate dehydrogenase/arogenate dehydrogenase family protein, partial [Ktedonobacterales bacterium]|nr:prephenate dehydrogenase/arogenate dehydrogenase family protein [Ktedonobacterales bacterium]